MAVLITIKKNGEDFKEKKLIFSKIKKVRNLGEKLEFFGGFS
jgi:hypothetical protein